MTRSGLFPRFARWLFGERAHRLSEELQANHWMSYLLVLTQSIAVVLVLGHAQLPLLLTGDIVIRVICALVLFLLLATVYAADMALLATLRRIPILARNRSTFALWEHVTYVLFVLLIEGSTYAVVMAALDHDPRSLMSAAPLIPQNGPVWWAQVVLRAVLICWTSLQLFIVRGKLAPQLSTLLGTGKAIVGGHVELMLTQLDMAGASIADSFRLYAAMSRTARRHPSWWNGWLVRMEAHQEAEEERQTQLVTEALQSFEANRLLLSEVNAAPLPLPAPSVPPEVFPVAPELPERPPTGPGSPSAKPRAGTVRGSNRLEADGKPARVVPMRRPGKVAAKASVEGKARRVYVAGMSVPELMRRAKISRSSASKWHKVLSAEVTATADGMAQ